MGIIKVIDLLAVRKDRTGKFMVMMASDLNPEGGDRRGLGQEAHRSGWAAAKGAEIGAQLGAEALADGHVFEADEAPVIAETMRPDTTYVISSSSTWAIPLRAKIDQTGGSVIADEWIGIPDLISIGYAADQPRGRAESIEDQSIEATVASRAVTLLERHSAGGATSRTPSWTSITSISSPRASGVPSMPLAG